MVQDPSAPSNGPEAPRLIPLEEMSVRQLEILRHVLRGNSVVDWRSAPFNTRDEVDQFLRLFLLDMRSPSDRACANRILKEAVDYLRATFHYKVADAVAEPFEVQDLFLFASGHHPRFPRRYQKIACIVLKVMHVIQHTESRELLFHTPIASSVMHQLLHERVMACAAEMKAAGFPVADFSGSMKTHHSMITKLLAKRETVSTQVFDKVRYRIVVKELTDVLPVFEYLTRALFPYSLVVASETENRLIDLKALFRGSPVLMERLAGTKLLNFKERDSIQGAANPFSSDSFRVLNFVVELPLRIDAYLPDNGGDNRLGRPRVIFGPVEFQMLDARSAQANEEGDRSHDAYKQRQRDKVLRRLSTGLIVPKRGSR